MTVQEAWDEVVSKDEEAVDALAEHTWDNWGGMALVTTIKQKVEGTEGKQEEEKYFSASEILPWEKKHSKANGKYIEALQASISSQISGKIPFHNAIANVC